MSKNTVLSMGLLVVLAGCSGETQGPNRPPVAVAGLDQAAVVDQLLTLDGRASYDPDGTVTRFHWSLIDAPANSLRQVEGGDSSTASLRPDLPGTWAVSLVVGDGRLESLPDVVRFQVVAVVCNADADGDGYVAVACPGGDDCDDGNGQVNPGQVEAGPGEPLCRDGLDNDCDGQTDASDSGCRSCNADGECGDGNPCTLEVCDTGICRNPPVTDGTVCDDGLYCTGSDACATGACTGEARDCADADPCTRDSCLETAGRCDHVRQPNPGAEGPAGDASCSNGLDDDCDDNTDAADPDCAVCGEAQDCDDDNPCTADDCEAGACTHRVAGDGTACDDQDSCTVDDGCQAGVCSGKPLDADGDGQAPLACNGPDCDDDSGACGAACLAGGTEVCDGYDNDCDSQTDENDTYSDWWNEDWHARRKLTFDTSGVTSALADFPVLVVLRAAFLDYGQTQPDGVDLRFVTADGGAVLPYHVERWSSGGASHVWVRVPALEADSTAGFIWMYYDNPEAPDVRDPAGTYDAGFAGVWHLGEEVNDESSSGVHRDSTAGGHDGSQNHNDDVAGKIGRAQFFDGNSDYVQVPHDSGLNLPDDWTIELWAYPSSLPSSSSWRAILSKDCDNDEDHRAPALYQYGSRVEIWYTPETLALRSNSDLVAEHWYYLVAQLDGSTLSLFINGQFDRSVPANKADTSSYDLYFGQRGNHTSFHTWYYGALDEIRISDQARGADWVRAQYRSMNEQFVTFGDEQALCP